MSPGWVVRSDLGLRSARLTASTRPWLLAILAGVGLLSTAVLTPAAVAHADPWARDVAPIAQESETAGQVFSPEANRFGPPWLGVIVAPAAVAYTEPSFDSTAVGPLFKDARLPVLRAVEGEPGLNGDPTWYDTPVGYLPRSVLGEDRAPWLAEVVLDQVPVYAKPYPWSGVRRSAARGDLLRVTGLSPGLRGDRNVWWAVTEGYVQLDALQPAAGDVVEQWTLPKPDEALKGWWGTVVTGANVRVAPSTSAPIVGRFAGGERVKVLAEEQGENVQGNATWYRIDGGRFAGARIHSSLVRRIAPPRPNTTAPRDLPPDRTWIVVDRRASTLTLVQDGRAVFVTYVALGRAGRDTPPGEYGTIGKYRYDDMTSTSVPNATDAYDLPNVPSTQYFRLGGYAIHGTYWHDQFGTGQSQGCVNLTVTDGAYLFERTRPRVPLSENARWSTSQLATPVLIVG